MNKMGFNIQVPGAGLDLIGRYRPIASLLMDIKSEHVAEAKRLSPETEIIFRKEDGRKWRDKNPVEWAQAMWADIHECPPAWVVPDNEPLGHAAVNEFAAFDHWQRTFADWIHANTPMKVGAFGFPEGNFTKDGPVIPEHFPLSMEAADAVFIHEYWKPFLTSEGMIDYHCLRWPYWLKWFEDAGHPNMPIYVTEVGITIAVNALPHGEPSGPDVGYASEEAKAAGVTGETYLADLEEYHRRCCLEPRLKAILPFIWHPWPGEWGSFVPTPSMTERIFSFDAPQPEPDPEPEPEPEPEENMVIVYGDGGVLLEGEAASDMVALHGLSWEMPPNLQPGDKFYNLKALRFKTGNVAFIYRVRDLDGNLIVNLDEEMDRSKAHRAWWWPDVCDANDIITHYPTDHDACADLGGLNENGEGGSPIDAWHDPYQPGPYRAWIRHPTIPSVILKGVGMEGSTNHDHMDGEWQEEVFGNGDDPEPDPTEKAGFYEVSRKWVPGDHNYIRLIPQNHDLYDMRGQLSCWDWEGNLVSPISLNGEPIFEFDTTYVEAQDRPYRAEIVYLPTFETVGGPFECEFLSSAKGTWHVEIEWRTEDDVPEPEPPEPSDHAARLRTVADELYQIADDLGPGGIKRITVEYASGVSQIFKPVADLGALVSNLIRRLKWN